LLGVWSLLLLLNTINFIVIQFAPAESSSSTWRLPDQRPDQSSALEKMFELFVWNLADVWIIFLDIWILINTYNPTHDCLPGCPTQINRSTNQLVWGAYICSLLRKCQSFSNLFFLKKLNASITWAEHKRVIIAGHRLNHSRSLKCISG
jgi:hypothetical protein